ncbi:MAG: 30S ribosomal protein S12 methylthiotransferase RimO [Bacteroidales bacterium]
MKTNPLKGKKINLISLGCSKALVDSETLMGQLKANGLTVDYQSPEPGHDAVIINTCGFINDAKEESIETILRFVQASKEGEVGEVYVMGCLSERYMNDLKKEIPDVTRYFGVNDLASVVKHFGGEYRKELIGERRLTTPSHFAYLKISEGCDRRCTFCAIPKIRGRHHSRPMEEIVEEAERLAGRGVKELILIAQDLTYYGIDLYKRNRLAELLVKLGDIPGIRWIRLHYAYPAGFPEEIIPVIRDHEKVLNYLDMPIQHINNRILSLMQRGHSQAATIKLLERIKKEIPDIVLRTTLIAGFPGETDSEFAELEQFVRDFRFHRLGVFAYSHEEGTTAFKLEDSVPDRIKQERVARIMEVQQEISLQYNESLVNTTIEVIVDRLENDYYVGRTQGDSPEVDNEVLIPSSEPDIYPGKIVPVKITSADYFDLTGVVARS